MGGPQPSQYDHMSKKIQTPPATPAYRENYERIFGKPKPKQGK